MPGIQVMLLERLRNGRYVFEDDLYSTVLCDHRILSYSFFFSLSLLYCPDLIE